MQAIPADDAISSVLYGNSTNLEPAVHAIGTTDSVLRVISSWVPGFNRVFPRGQHARKVVRMNDVGVGPTFQFFKCLAGIIQALLTDEFEFALRPHSKNKAGNAVDDQAKTLFACAEALLSPLPVFNFSGNTIPANYADSRIPQGLSSSMKPAIYVIEPAHTLVYFTRLTGFDGMQPRLFRALNILGMEYVGPSKTHQVLLTFASKVQNALIQIFDLPIRTRIPRERGNTVNNQAKTLFACAHGLLGML